MRGINAKFESSNPEIYHLHPSILKSPSIDQALYPSFRFRLIVAAYPDARPDE